MTGITRIERDARRKIITDRREAERIEYQRSKEAQREQARRDKLRRQRIGALARVRLLSQCSPDVYEAFETYCEKARTEWMDAPVHLDHEYLRTLPRPLYSRLMAFMHAYQGAGGVAFLWAIKAEQRRSART